MARGDHIYVHCMGYSHHGIDLGDGNVIHFDFHPWQALSRKLAKVRDPEIRKVTMEKFSQNRPVVVRRYHECDDVEAVIERAESRVGEKGYHLFENNCEHFASWCKTGESRSTQVDDFREATVSTTKSIPTAAILWRAGRRLPMRLRTVAYGAAFAMTAGAFAHRYLENRLRRSQRYES